MDNNNDNNLNFSGVQNTINEICSECDLQENGNCIKSTCLIGFAAIVVKYHQTKGTLNIPGAESLIPNKDFKVYDKDLVAAAIAETCKLCRQCRENHANNCVIALIRNSMEYAFWGKSLPYPGNILQYVNMVREKDPELAGYIMNNYKRKE